MGVLDSSQDARGLGREALVQPGFLSINARGIERQEEHGEMEDTLRLQQSISSRIIEITVTIPIPPTSTETSTNSLITAPPSLWNRAPLPEAQAGCDCNSQINQFKSQASEQNSQQLSQATQQFSQQISQISQRASQSVGQAQQAQSSAQVEESAARAAQSSAQVAASVAQSSLSSIQTSASSAIAAASASASSAAVSAMMSVSMAFSSASASASVAIASAEASARDARAAATFEISQAQATISLTKSQASASVRSSQVQAITATQVAIAIVGSIIGSSILSILIYFLLARYRKRKQTQDEDDTSQRYYKEPLSPVISEPQSQNLSISYVDPPPEFSFSAPKPTRVSSMRSSNDSLKRKSMGAESMDLPFTFVGELEVGNEMGAEMEAETERPRPRPSLGGSKRTLVYDLDHPDQPPKFDTGDETGEVGEEDRNGDSDERKKIESEVRGRGKKASIGKAF